MIYHSILQSADITDNTSPITSQSTNFSSGVLSNWVEREQSSQKPGSVSTKGIFGVLTRHTDLRLLPPSSTTTFRSLIRPRDSSFFSFFCCSTYHIRRCSRPSSAAPYSAPPRAWLPVAHLRPRPPPRRPSPPLRHTTHRTPLWRRMPLVRDESSSTKGRDWNID